MSFFSEKYKKVQRLLKRHPFLHYFRCFLITRKPSHSVFSGEAINKYNSKKSIPQIFRAENEKIPMPLQGSFKKAVAIAKFLRTSYAGGRGLGYSSAETLEIMKANMGGVCSDFSQLMINFCILNDIQVREWSLSEKLYGNFGHVFNEVYSDELKKWVLIDASKNLYFIHQQTKEPLSCIEYIDLLTSGNEQLISIFNIISEKEDNAIKAINVINLSYFTKDNIFFLVSNYRIKALDKVLTLRKKFPLPILHFALISIGSYYRYHFYINKFNSVSTRNKLSSIRGKNYGNSFLVKQTLLQKAQKLLQPLPLILIQSITDIF